jgi:hypothetical protein
MTPIIAIALALANLIITAAVLWLATRRKP